MHIRWAARNFWMRWENAKCNRGDRDVEGKTAKGLELSCRSSLSLWNYGSGGKQGRLEIPMQRQQVKHFQGPPLALLVKFFQWFQKCLSWRPAAGLCGASRSRVAGIGGDDEGRREFLKESVKGGFADMKGAGQGLGRTTYRPRRLGRFARYLV
ncbi:hypothetical protein K438DRAFT_1747864 [Mycena galopus ATCC 62051]|nr:hypothetical protein K438DRAFT_1747864 [Mycena galopus ATCC 62051]